MTALERQKAESLILRMIQHENFVELFSKIEENTVQEVKHDLAKYSLSVDSKNIIRLKDHLNRATINDYSNYPALFSARHPPVVLMLGQ